MAGTKISQLPTATTPLTGAELVPVVQSGSTYQTTSQGVANLAALPLAASGGSNLVGFLQSGTGAVARTVQDKERDTVSVKDFGAVGDGVTDDTAAIQAAVNAGANEIRFPAGSYKVTSAITVTSDYRRLVGAGIGASTILNAGTGNAVEVKSLGGVSATRIGCGVANLTIDGQNIGAGLYVYDVAQCRFDRIEVKRSTGAGINANMIVDCTFNACVTTSNTTDGILLSYGNKNGVEFQSNAVIVDSCVAYSNSGAGVRVLCGYGNRIRNGEYSSNNIGVHLEGGMRTTVDGAWVENNTTNSVKVINATTALGVGFDGSNNQIINSLLTGTGSVSIGSGNKNFVQANYIGHNVTIGASASATFFGPQAQLVGTLTDSGSGTIDWHDPMAMYWKSSGLKRLQINVGSTVDFTSDIQALRFAQVKGLSGTSTASQNFSGYADITGATTTATVTFGTSESDAAYGVLFGTWFVSGTPASGSSNAYMTSRATSGFTINLQTAPGVGNTVRVYWMVIR